MITPLRNRLVVVASAATLGAAAASGSLDVAIGKALFERVWVPAPSSTRANDGLGPLFNARSCAQCHAGGGAGRLIVTGSGYLADRGGVVRLSRPDGAPDPVYGAQVQTIAIPGRVAEARVRLGWEYHDVLLADGTRVALRRPRVELEDLAYGPLASDTRISLTLAPDLRAAAQIAQVNLTRFDGEAASVPRIFGRKATEATLAQAVSRAFSRDLGLSTAAHPGPGGDCTTHQLDCLAGPHGETAGAPEISEALIAPLVAYLTALEPVRPVVHDAEGQRLFEVAGCSGCHTPSVSGSSGAPVFLYSDLRLHDLGDDLAGNAEPGGATAAEWRTAPLAGLDARLARGGSLLHDGRARTVAEAILWHGGAAMDARTRYMLLPAAGREALDRHVLSR